VKNISIILAVGFVSIVAGCNQTEEAIDPTSKWHLVAQLMDPGDGSGTFQPVTSDKTVSFFEDGSLTSENGSICIGEVWSGGTSSTGTYSESTMIIEVDNCTGGHVSLSYELDGDHLILNYACIEPCREKYERLE